MKSDTVTVTQRRIEWPLVFIAVVVFLIAFTTRRTEAFSDPTFTFLEAQTFIKQGTIQLDAYAQETVFGVPFRDYISRGHIQSHNSHYYDYFPAGTTFLSVPLVIVTSAFQLNAELRQHNALLHRVFSSFTCVIILLIVYHIARIYLGKTSSLIIATISILGSGLISSLGTAVWSLNFSTIFIGLSVLLLAHFDTGRAPTVRPILLGVCLFLAYFSRASSAAFIIVVFLYLFIKDRRQFFKVGIVAGSLFGLFLLWSMNVYGQLLPSYYSIGRFEAGAVPTWVAIYGHLFSPSRGVFVFSPFLILVLVGLARFWRVVSRQLLVWLCIGWFALHVFIASRAVVWWGGNSFGPRILTDSLIGLILLSVILWGNAKCRLSLRWKRVVAGAYIVLGLLAIGINMQGLYNRNVSRWHGYVEPVVQPPFTGLGDLFTWRYAQFLASNDRLCTIHQEHMEALLPYVTVLQPYEWGRPIRYDMGRYAYVRDSAQHAATESTPQNTTSHSARERLFLPLILDRYGYDIDMLGVFIGWSRVNVSSVFRWSECDPAHIVFRLDDVVVDGEYVLEVKSNSLGRQRTTVSLNGSRIGAHTFADAPGAETVIFRFDGTLFKSNDLNRITFHLPDSRRPDNGDLRYLALAFHELRLYAVD